MPGCIKNEIFLTNIIDNISWNKITESEDREGLGRGREGESLLKGA